MKKGLKIIRKRIVRRIWDFRDRTSRKWVTYNYVRIVYLFLVFPLLFLLANTYEQLTPFWVFLLCSPAMVFVLLDSKRLSVALENPKAFLKSEKAKHIVWILFYFSLALSFVFMLFIIGMDKLGLGQWIGPFIRFIVSPVVALMVGAGITLEVEIAEVGIGSFLALLMRKLLARKPALLQTKPVSIFYQLLAFYVPLTIQTRARFCAVLELLSKNPNAEMINKRLPLFKEAIGIYDKHLRAEFDFVLRDPKKFYKYVKLAAYTKESVVVDNIRKELKVLIKLMKVEEENPFEVIKSLRNMIKESTSIEDVFKEIEVEPKRYRRWFSAHLDSVTAIIAFISLVVTIASVLHK